MYAVAPSQAGSNRAKGARVCVPCAGTEVRGDLDGRCVGLHVGAADDGADVDFLLPSLGRVREGVAVPTTGALVLPCELAATASVGSRWLPPSRPARLPCTKVGHHSSNANQNCDNNSTHHHIHNLECAVVAHGGGLSPGRKRLRAMATRQRWRHPSQGG